MKNIMKVHFEPCIADLTEILPKAGFRKLTDATPADLPTGALVSVYNSCNNSLYTIIIFEHDLDNCFTYINYFDDDEEIVYSKTSNFMGTFYKVIGQLPVVDTKPQLNSLPNIISEAGFQFLDKANQDDLPDGCVAILYSTKNNALVPIVVRTLSLSNQRLLYQSEGTLAGNWENKVLMDSENYLYKVIS